MNAHPSLLVALVASALACSHPTAPPEALAPTPAPPRTVEARVLPSVLEEGAVRAAPTPPRSAPSSGTTHPATPAPTPIARAPRTDDVRVSVTHITATEGEDGHGNTTRATDAVAIDLERADGWQAGALTTTLCVGDLRFYAMGYPSVTVMRFVVADGRTLPRGAEVALQYGPDPARRRVIAPALPVTP
jgi:hypothetical protein